MIRIAQKNDWYDCYGLICVLENETLDEDVFHKIFLNQQKDENMCCLLYEEGGRIMAMCNIRFDVPLHHCSAVAEIIEFVVLKEHRGKGIGEKMFKAACVLAKKRGCEQIELVTNQRRKKAHRFYERMGMIQSHYGYARLLK